MRRFGNLLTATAMLLGSAAYADDYQQTPSYDQNQQGQSSEAAAGTITATPVDNTKENYPGEFVARPLVLPPMMGQPTLLVGINNVPGATGENVAAAFDMGLMDKLQAGAMIQFPINNPDPTFGLFLANAQYNVIDFLNVRLDVGAVKVPGTAVGAGTFQGDTGFAFGVGAVLKYKINDMLAITSGRPVAWAYGEDLIQMQFVSGAKLGYIHIPVGLLAQLHPMVAVGLRVAGRFAIADAKRTGNEIYIPVAVDLMANIMKPLDLGFSFELPGNKDAYADFRQFTIWASYRL